MSNVNPAPIIASHGTFEGVVLGAEVLLSADIAYQQLINRLEATAAQYATTLADDENKIQDQLATMKTNEFAQYNMTLVIVDIQQGTVTASDQAAMQGYTTALGVDQSEVQAATKAIDPVLTTEQNQPSALQQGANEFIQEVGTVNQGSQALANDRIG